MSRFLKKNVNRPLPPQPEEEFVPPLPPRSQCVSIKQTPEESYEDPNLPTEQEYEDPNPDDDNEQTYEDPDGMPIGIEYDDFNLSKTIEFKEMPLRTKDLARPKLPLPPPNRPDKFSCDTPRNNPEGSAKEPFPAKAESQANPSSKATKKCLHFPKIEIKDILDTKLRSVPKKTSGLEIKSCDQAKEFRKKPEILTKKPELIPKDIREPEGSRHPPPLHTTERSFRQAPSQLPSPFTPKSPIVAHPSEEIYDDAEELKEKLFQFEWFYGKMTRRSSETKLRSVNKDGSFLVRNSNGTNERQPYTMEVLYMNKIYVLRIRLTNDGKMCLGEEKKDEKVFNDVEDLVSYYQRNELRLIGEPGGLTILKVFPR